METADDFDSLDPDPDAFREHGERIDGEERERLESEFEEE